MSDHERLLGELKEFKRATLLQLAELQKGVDELKHLRWKLAGAATGAAAVVSAVVSLLVKLKA